MAPDRWKQIKQIFGQVLEIEENQQESFLQKACQHDLQLLEEVKALLQASQTAENLFDMPPVNAGSFQKMWEEQGVGVEPSQLPGSMVCSRCHMHFTSIHRFCPYDGTPLDNNPNSLVGTILDGRYLIEAFLGQGAMGRVYRAERLSEGDRVAIKILARNLLESRTWIRRFKREGRAGRRFRHPNAVAVLDTRTAPDGLIYMALEYVEGRTLRAEISERKRFSPVKTLEILEKVASVLDAAHARGVVHRDLKPENVMVNLTSSSTSLVKVLDLGIAKVANLDGSGTISSMLTQSGMLLGTPLYMSPEQWGSLPRDGSSEIDGRADVYSLGVMAYEMVSGVQPFKGEGLHEIHTRHVARKVPSLDEICPEVPEKFARAVDCAMAKDRADRFLTAGEFIKELRSALETNA